MGSFYEKGVNYKWVVIQNQIHIRDKVKVVLDLSNYYTIINLLLFQLVWVIQKEK